MAGITLAIAEAQLTAAIDALMSASKVKETQVTGSVGGRKIQFQDVDKLQATVEFWNKQVKLLSRNGGAGGISFFYGVPRG